MLTARLLLLQVQRLLVVHRQYHLPDGWLSRSLLTVLPAGVETEEGLNLDPSKQSIPRPSPLQNTRLADTRPRHPKQRDEDHYRNATTRSWPLKGEGVSVRLRAQRDT